MNSARRSSFSKRTALRGRHPAWIVLAVVCAAGLAGCAGPYPDYVPDRSARRPLPRAPESPVPRDHRSGGHRSPSRKPLPEQDRSSEPTWPDARRETRPLTASRALGLYDPARDASLRLVIAGLDEDQGGSPSRALASYQRAVRVDSTNPFAYLALSRHHLEVEDYAEASAFLDQARGLFESEDRIGPEVDVWGLGLRAGIDRGLGRDRSADSLLEAARELSPSIWADGRLSAAELR